MWQKLKDKLTQPSIEERTLKALEENNALLRQLLTSHGVTLPAPTRVNAVPSRKRTERDITVQTRETILEQQHLAQQARLHEPVPASAKSGTTRGGPTNPSNAPSTS